MQTFRRGAHQVDAMLFDGSSEAAARISAMFSGAVAHDRDRIEVATAFGRVYAGANCWVVRDAATRRLSVVDNREFAAHFEAVDGLPDVRLGGH